MKKSTIFNVKIFRFLVLFSCITCNLPFISAQTIIQIGQTYSFSQSPKSTINYQVNIQTPGEVSIFFTGWLSTYNWGRDFDRIYITNDQGASIGRNSLSSVDDPFLFHMFQGINEMKFRVGQAGIYNIAVHSGDIYNWESATSQSYTILVTVAGSNDIYEPNETFETATAINIDSTITAYQWKQIKTTAVWDDEDWYKITITSPGILKIKMANWIGVFNWSANYDRLWVYNSKGVSIGKKSGNDFYSWMMSGTDSIPHNIEMNLAHADTYYLRFHAGDGVSLVPYHFTTSFIPTNDSFEPNDKFADAKQIQASNIWYQANEWRSLDSTMNVTGDEDYYYFMASGAGQYSITLDGWIGIYNWGADYDRLYVYDAAENPVGTSPLRSMISTTPTNFTVPSAGKYYIRLHCGSGYSIDGYKFMLTGNIVGLKDINATESFFQFHPNPASNTIKLKINNASNDQMICNIYNSIGMLVKSEIIHQELQNIKVGNLPNGFYSVTVQHNGSTYKQSLLIQK